MSTNGTNGTVRPVRQWHDLTPAEQARVMAGLRALAQEARQRQKPTADFWLVRDEARVSWAQLRRAIAEQRGKYAEWVTARDGAKPCERPCCALPEIGSGQWDAPQSTRDRQVLYTVGPLR